MKNLSKLITGLFLLSLILMPYSTVLGDDFVAEYEDENSSNNFTLDADDTGGDVTLQFGAALAEYLKWDNGNLRFELSDDLNVMGDITSTGTSFTLDSDNAGAGANLDIIANQGSDSDGTLRYDATANEWQISNDGGGFVAIGSGTGHTQNTDTGSTTNTFTIDNDDTGGNVIYQFGAALAETLLWDNGNTRFTFSDDLRTEGNMAIVGIGYIAGDHAATDSDGTLSLGRDGSAWETLMWDDSDSQFEFTDDLDVAGDITLAGTAFTLDSDNAGAGANTDIVSNQGSDSDGTLRYNATANQWEISNDGGGFNAISTGVTYTEAFAVIADPASTNQWLDEDLFTNHGVPKGAIAEILIESTGDALTYGMRTNGSVLERKLAPKKGANVMTVLTDANGIIELNQSSTSINFTLIGYWE